MYYIFLTALRNESERIGTNTVKCTNTVPRVFQTLSQPPLGSHNIRRATMLCKVCCDLSSSMLLTTPSKTFSLLSMSDHCSNTCTVTTQCSFLVFLFSLFYFFLLVTLIPFHNFNYL